jgi:outer membrane lipoprotein-sorting protein
MFWSWANFMPLSSRFRLVFVLVVVVPFCGCLFHSRKVERKVSTAPLKSATQAELVTYINDQAKKIQSMQATVDIDTSVGGEQKGKVTDYKQIRGYVLARKPAMLRMIGLMPIVRNKAFDMVSNGSEFKVWVPSKNRFVEGRNDYVSPNPDHSLENLRPQAIYEAILLQEIDEKKGEIAVLENGYEQVLDSKRRPVMQPDYEIIVVKKGDQGAYLSRKIIFGRTDLMPHEQLIYDQKGNLQTQVQYADYKDFDGISFPNKTEIQRPQEEYDITLTIVKLELNQKLADDKFALEQPPGAQVVHMDQPHSELKTPPQP